MNPNQDGALSVSRVAEELQVCKKTARRIIDSGDLRAHRIRRQWRVFRKDFEEYLARQANQHAA